MTQKGAPDEHLFAFPGHSGFAVGWRRRPFIQQALLLQRTPEIIRDRRGNPLEAVFQLRYRAGAGNNRGHRRVSQTNCSAAAGRLT